MTEEGTPAEVVKSTGGESPGLLVIGAGVIAGNWLLFDIIAGEWNQGIVYTALALIVLASAYKVLGIEVGITVQRVIGYFMGLAAVVILIGDLRFGDFPDDGLTILAYVLFVAGSVLMFMGARALSD